MIGIRNLSKWYGAFQVLKSCSLDIAKGEVVVVCGPSGSGKSTLIKCVNGLEPFEQGDIVVDGIEVADKQQAKALCTRTGMVFQSFELYPHLTAMGNICLAPMVVLKRSKADAEARARTLLERAGLADHANKFPAQLSGGQQQRVAIARALVTSPSLLLADEPTGNLDSRTKVEIMRLLVELNERRGITIAMVTHEPEMAEYVQRVLLFRDGHILREGSPDALRISTAPEPRPPAP